MAATVTFDNPSDNIDSLPTDKNPPSKGEIDIMESLFKKTHGTVEKLFDGTKDIMLIGLLFIIFSIPQLDGFVHKIVPSTANSPYILLFVKTLFFMFVYFLIKNLYLVRK